MPPACSRACGNYRKVRWPRGYGFRPEPHRKSLEGASSAELSLKLKRDTAARDVPTLILRLLRSERFTPTLHRMNLPTLRSLIRVVLTLLALGAGDIAFAASAGLVVGRVKNAETGEFVYNAQVKLGALAATATDQFGAYRFDNVPVGETSVRVVYNGMVAAAVTVQVVEGRETVADVALRSIDAPTQLDAFQVNVSRQMSGIDLAVNSQRYSSNIKSVISSEQMGFIGDGNVAAALRARASLTPRAAPR